MMKLSVLFAACLLFRLTVLQAQNQEPIKGTWITNVASQVLLSKSNIKEAVATCKKQGLNNIYVVVWNKGLTMYPSKVLQQYIGIKQDSIYGGFDPIACMIEEAHALDIKVHAWFEFGFSYAYKDSANLWAKKYPRWIGRNNKGEALNKNGFMWWNSIHPEVQNFMKKLILEVVAKYDVDGIQGDDRLPAMPAEGGYDNYTSALYKKQTGKTPPTLATEKFWLQWKADQLSNYGKSLYKAIKKERKNCIVSWAPSIYPWSKENYLQDWPKWLNGGYADYILPQLYRYDIKAYEKILIELNQQIKPHQKSKVFPGLLTALGSGYLVSNELLQQMIALNRKYGFEGEVFFYYECLPKLQPIY